MLGFEEDIKAVEKTYELIMGFLVQYSFQLVGALFVFLVGLYISGKLAKMVMNFCQSKQMDVTLSRFLSNLTKAFAVTMVAIICLNMIGVSITPLVAAIGAASLGAGLAVQGLLSNYGAGFNIILTRPYVIGDTVTIQGVSGEVKDILLAHTILLNEDGVEITIPNRHIVGEILQNSQKLTLVELRVGVAYSSDLDFVISVLHEAVGAHEYVGENANLQVGIEEFGDSSVNILVRFGAPTESVVASRLALNKVIWDTLQAKEVQIPFPQREVTLLQGG